MKYRGYFMSKYITEIERYRIETMLDDGLKPKEIAQRLNKHYTTIYREIKRGTVTLISTNLVPYDKYCADYSQTIHTQNSHNKGVNPRYTDISMLDKITHLIAQKRYSPYAVSRLLKAENPDISICKGTIYNYINSKKLNIKSYQMPYNKSRKGRKKSEPRHSYKLLSRPIIEDRPPEALDRKSFGHWELDTVVSGKNKGNSCLLVLTERSTRYEIIRKLPNLKTETVVKEINSLEKDFGYRNFSNTFKSITCDNGVEFSDWKGIIKSCISKKHRTNIYFCHAYASYERGSNENNNKLIRRFIPKGSDISKVSDKEVKYIENWINNYPRELFNGLSSIEYLKQNFA